MTGETQTYDKFVFLPYTANGRRKGCVDHTSLTFDSRDNINAVLSFLHFFFLKRFLHLLEFNAGWALFVGEGYLVSKNSNEAPEVPLSVR